MTNGEKIRSMTNEELADFLAPVGTECLVPDFCDLCFERYEREYDGLKPVCYDSASCRFYPGDSPERDAWLWWLESEERRTDGEKRS